HETHGFTRLIQFRVAQFQLDIGGATDRYPGAPVVMAGLSGISMVPRQFVVTTDRGHTRQRVILQCRAPVATAHAVVYLLLQGDHASAGQEPAGLAYKYGLDLATLPCQLGRQADL